MDSPDFTIKPSEFRDFLERKLKSVYNTGEAVTITTITDYGYFNSSGLRADEDDDSELSIDFRNPKVDAVTISLITSKSKGKHINIERKIYYIDISDDGRYTTLSTRQGRIYSIQEEKSGSDKLIEEGMSILRRIFSPYYPGNDSYTGYPINTVVTDTESLRSIYKDRGIDSKSIYREYIRLLIKVLVGHVNSTYVVYGDDGEESKWENETDQLNRLKILYALFCTKPYDDSLGTSPSSIINAITNLNI